MNPYENDPREPIKEWEAEVKGVTCVQCQYTITTSAVFCGYADGSYDACWLCYNCDTENTTVFEAVEVGEDACAHEGTMGTIDLDTEMVSCDECGYTEPADQDDLANHRALRDTGKGVY
jgi:hypothetical protein